MAVPARREGALRRGLLAGVCDGGQVEGPRVAYSHQFEGKNVQFCVTSGNLRIGELAAILLRHPSAEGMALDMFVLLHILLL